MTDIKTTTGGRVEFATDAHPMVVILPGDGTVSVFNDDFTGESGMSLPPVQRAVTVARLRVLADLIEVSA